VVLATMSFGPAFAGFFGTDLYVPSIGRKVGLGGTFWHTALWVHNPSGASVAVTVQYLPRNSSALPPGMSQTFTVPAGGTWQDSDAINTLFPGLSGYGALRITSTAEVLANCRMYNQPDGTLLKDTTGQDYAAIPSSFAIASGQVTQVLGAFSDLANPDPDFRTGFGYVEVSGNPANVRVKVFAPDGTQMGSWDDPTPLQPYENRYYTDMPVKFPAASGTNLRLQVEVTGGSGKILAVGSLVSNGPSDGTTFEMAFADQLLGVSNVIHDATLAGNGTAASPLGIATGQVVTSVNGLKDAVTLQPGANTAITPSGSILTISTTGLSLPFTGTATSPDSLFSISNTSGLAITGSSGGTVGVKGAAGGASHTLAYVGAAGVWGDSAASVGVYGTSTTNAGVAGASDSSAGVSAQSAAASTGAVYAYNTGGGRGVWGYSPSGYGVEGQSGGSIGVLGFSTSGDGLQGTSSSGFGVHGISSTGEAGHFEGPVQVIGGLTVTGALSFPPGQLVKSLNGLKDAVTLQAGANTTITPSGNTLTIASSGLVLPFAGQATTVSSVPALEITSLGGSGGPAIKGTGNDCYGVVGSVGPWAGGNCAGVMGQGGTGIFGVEGYGVPGGVYGLSQDGNGVEGHSSNGAGAYGVGEPGVSGYGPTGVKGVSTSATEFGVSGINNFGGEGVRGETNSSSGIGVFGVAYGSSGATRGVLGTAYSGSGYGVEGVGNGPATGVYGVGTKGVLGEGTTGVHGKGSNVGVLAENTVTATTAYLAGQCCGGYFLGAGYFSGYLTKAGGGFQIDHPLDPEHKVLNHSFVESPDMKNVYDGVITTDADGLAVVELPPWFGALNRDFRYQLTVIGRFAQAIVEQEIEGNRFTIRTNLANVKVSWQVTGIRQDPWANANRKPVEEDKIAPERGTYLHPEAYGKPKEMAVERVRFPAETRAAASADATTAPGAPPASR
jgi:hypothetical protein